MLALRKEHPRAVGSQTSSQHLGAPPQRALADASADPGDGSSTSLGRESAAQPYDASGSTNRGVCRSAAPLAAAGCGNAATPGGQDVQPRPPVGRSWQNRGVGSASHGGTPGMVRRQTMDIRGLLSPAARMDLGRRRKRSPDRFLRRGSRPLCRAAAGPPARRGGHDGRNAAHVQSEWCAAGPRQRRPSRRPYTDGRLREESQIKRGLIAVEPASDSVLYVTPSDELVRTDGLRTTRFGDVSRLAGDPEASKRSRTDRPRYSGLGGSPSFGPSGRLITSAPVRRRALLRRTPPNAGRVCSTGRARAAIRAHHRTPRRYRHRRAALPRARVSRTVATIPVSLQACGSGSHRDVERIVDPLPESRRSPTRRRHTAAMGRRRSSRESTRQTAGGGYPVAGRGGVGEQLHAPTASRPACPS